MLAESTRNDDTEETGGIALELGALMSMVKMGRSRATRIPRREFSPVPRANGTLSGTFRPRACSSSGTELHPDVNRLGAP